MTMSTFDALEAWQAGEITSSRAMLLTNTCDLLDLYALAAECDVEMRTGLFPTEQAAVANVIDAVDRAIASKSRARAGLEVA